MAYMSGKSAMFSGNHDTRQIGVTGKFDRLKTLDRVDKRSRLWRRRKRRHDEIVASLGGPNNISPQHRELIDLLLGLSAVVEDFQAKLAAGQEVDTERFLSAVKEQRRVVGELHLPSGPPPAPTLAQHLARRAAERASAAAESEAT
jgi:hypothetical protein